MLDNNTPTMADSHRELEIAVSLCLSRGHKDAVISMLRGWAVFACEAAGILERCCKHAEQNLAKWENDPLSHDGPDANPIDTIAAKNGWRPLTPGESMTVHFNGIGYEIIRGREATNETA